MDKFLLAENPMIDPDDRDLYIIHAIPPFSMIQAVQGAGKAPVDQRLYQSFAFRNIQGTIEDWTLVIIYSEGTPEQADKLLSKAWRWYRSYMEWEDKNLSDE